MPSPAGRRAEHAASFSRGADVYAATRPDYPAPAVAFAVDAAPAGPVLDLGAGTGKLTAALAATGREVVAVEPSDEMRAVLSAALPTVRALSGTAESIPLPDASVAAVTVAQAWHWFDEGAAAAEIARVLAPGGRLTVLWNVRDESVPWVAAYSDVLRRAGSGPDQFTRHGAPSLGPAFAPSEAFVLRWSRPFPVADLGTLAASRSYVLVLPDEERAAALAQVDALAATHPDLAGRAEVDFPYVTYAWRAAVR